MRKLFVKLFHMVFGYRWGIIFLRNRDQRIVWTTILRAYSEEQADEKAWFLWEESPYSKDETVHIEIKLLSKVCNKRK
jgi:hypothetical protein